MVEEFKVAAIQIAPIYLDKNKTLKKIRCCIVEAANNNARLIVLPEVVFCGYPNWVTDLYFRDPNPKNYSWKTTFFDAAEKVPGKITDEICEIARNKSVYVVFGINEQDQLHRGLIYNAGILVSPEGEIILKHRKITPVFHEMFYYGKGNENDIRIAETEIGRIGIGICFEHLNPYYRRALAEQGEEIHCGLWVSPIGIEDLINTCMAMTAIESKIYVVTSCQVNPEDKNQLKQNWDFFGGSQIIDPTGRVLARATNGKEETIYSIVNLQRIITGRWRFNSFGRDARYDLFNPSPYRLDRGDLPER